MKVGRVFCFFEQSGTFKNRFKELGIQAEDFDILDDFGQTDHKADLFAEIEKAYDGEPSIFDDITPDDLILAFFPCTRFETVIPLAFRGEQRQQKNWTDEKKLAYSMKLHGELHFLYMLLCKLFTVCLRGGVSPHSREPVSPGALSEDIFSGEAEARHQRQNGRGRLLQKADSILVCELRSGAECHLRAA